MKQYLAYNSKGALVVSGSDKFRVSLIAAQYGKYVIREGKLNVYPTKQRKDLNVRNV